MSCVAFRARDLLQLVGPPSNRVGDVGDSKETAEPVGVGTDGAADPWELLVCGHSLGAGVATLLALILKSKYPRLTSIVYAPPGATLSTALGLAVTSFITSVVVGKDMVPRLSLPTTHALLGDVVRHVPRRLPVVCALFLVLAAAATAAAAAADDDDDADAAAVLRLLSQISVSLRAKASKPRILRRSICCPGQRVPVDELLYRDDEEVPTTQLRGLLDSHL